ncbi:MAG: hypothetical protein LBH96_05250 [Candidatus Peribacteria bacterium]|jgi:hypothetical protein|nr:hypothetical protein [Candidatus Peribacteria bacterium]
MNRRFRLSWDESTLLNLVKITSKGDLEKKLTETSPDDLKHFTQQTYSSFKKQFIVNHQQIFP